jgi:hypothetical protein
MSENQPIGPIGYEGGKKVVKQLRVMIDSAHSLTGYEEWVAKVKEALGPYGTVTITGQNYLIINGKRGGGKVCRIEDFDPETQDFKEGAEPPAWAGGPHRLSASGEKIPIEGAPASFRPGGPLPKPGKKVASRGQERPKPAVVDHDDDEDEIDLSELDVKEVEKEAESVAESTASEAAKKFTLKKK